MAVREKQAVVIEAMTPETWEGVARVYAEGIATGDATFETEVPSWETWDRTHLEGHRLVARRGGEIVGWAALAPVSDRCAYGGVAEISVYVAAEARGAGVGLALLEELIRSSEAGGIWTLQAGSFRRTRPACACTSGPASSSSAAGSGSAS